MNRRLSHIFWIACALASPLIPLHAYFKGNWYSLLHDYSLGMVCGIAGYCYFAVTLILAARIRFFDRRFGHDRVLVFHGWLATTAWLLILGHIGFKVGYSSLESTQIQLGVAATLLFGLVMTATLFFMTAGPLHRIAPFAKLQRVIRRGFNPDYSRVKLLHNLLAVAFLLSVVHTMMAISTAENRWRAGLMGGIGLAAALVWGYHKAIRPLVHPRAGRRIGRVTRLAPTITALEITGRPLRFQAGQFCYLRILSRQCGIEEHPFTIASPPHGETVGFTIKHLGDYTEELPGVPPGTRVLLDGPYGRFTPRCNSGPHLMVAGGIGITPFLAILADWDRRGIREPTVLIWSMHDEADRVDDGLFDAVAARHPAFRFVPLVTGKTGPEGRKQRIDRDFLAAHCDTVPPARSHACICGPVAMIDDVTRHLRDLGWRRDAILAERFTS